MTTNPDQVTVAELITALQRVEGWVRDIRTLLGQLDPNAALSTRPAAAMAAPPIQAQGACPPPLPPPTPPEKY
jgi:hypothetical protein